MALCSNKSSSETSKLRTEAEVLEFAAIEVEEEDGFSGGFEVEAAVLNCFRVIGMISGARAYKISRGLP